MSIRPARWLTLHLHAESNWRPPNAGVPHPAVKRQSRHSLREIFATQSQHCRPDRHSSENQCHPRSDTALCGKRHIIKEVFDGLRASAAESQYTDLRQPSSTRKHLGAPRQSAWHPDSIDPQFPDARCRCLPSSSATGDQPVAVRWSVEPEGPDRNSSSRLATLPSDQN